MPCVRSLAMICLQVPMVVAISGCGAPASTQQAQPPLAAPAFAQASPAEVDTELRKLHDQLRITPAQETQWNSLSQELKDASRKMQQTEAARSQTAASMRGMDEMKSREQIMQARMDAMHKIRPKAEQMYSSMSPEQQHMWDNVVVSRQVGGCGLLCRSGLGAF